MCHESYSAGYCNAPLCIVTLSFAYSSESHPALETSSRVFSESLLRGGKQFDIRETGPGRWCWHLIYILWPGLGGRTEWCMHARDSTQQQRASSHPMRDSDTTECRIDTNLNWLALASTELRAAPTQSCSVCKSSDNQPRPIKHQTVHKLMPCALQPAFRLRSNITSSKSELIILSSYMSLIHQMTICALWNVQDLDKINLMMSDFTWISLAVVIICAVLSSEAKLLHSTA